MVLMPVGYSRPRKMSSAKSGCPKPPSEKRGTPHSFLAGASQSMKYVPCAGLAMWTHWRVKKSPAAECDLAAGNGIEAGGILEAQEDVFGEERLSETAEDIF